MKRCARCGSSLPKDDFSSWISTGSKYYDSYCRECRRLYRASMYIPKVSEAEVRLLYDPTGLSVKGAEFDCLSFGYDVKARHYEPGALFQVKGAYHRIGKDYKLHATP